MSYQIDRVEKRLNTTWNIFNPIFIKLDLGEYKELIDEINALFYDQELNSK